MKKKILLIIISLLFMLSGCQEKTLGDIEVFSDIEVTTEGAVFSLNIEKEDTEISNVRILDQNYDEVFIVDVGETYVVDSLQSGKDYIIEVTVIDIESNSLYNTMMIPFTTLVKEKPSIILELDTYTWDSVTFRVLSVDPDFAGEIKEINLYQGDVLVAQTVTEMDFTELVDDTEYTIEVVYEYDMNDGSEMKYVTDEVIFTTRNVLVEYFIDVALGAEGGSITRVTRRWYEPMVLYYYGDYSEELEIELLAIIDELNDIFTDSFHITTTDKEDQANATLYFGDGRTYGKMYGLSNELMDSITGRVEIYQVYNIIESANMFVDTVKVGTTGQKHALREELTQSLGFLRDSYMYDDSIFYQEWNDVTEYSEEDIKLITLLYSDLITIGWGVTDCRENLPDIIDTLFE